MSLPPTAPDADIELLREEGFDVEIRGAYLLIRDLPYVNQACEVRRGILISSLERNEVGKPSTHVAYWTGEHPCHHNGVRINAFSNASPPQALGEGIQADFTFSAKADYRDFHHKMTTYIARIEGEARVIAAEVVARTFPVRMPDPEEAIFKYTDWASARARIGSYNEKLAHLRIGIAGIGGTGTYILDFLAKSRVKEIHLFDGDRYKQHNAFRAPGATSIESLLGAPPKVLHWSAVYGVMRHGLVPHQQFLEIENVSDLAGLDFVFLCMDTGKVKRQVVAFLEAQGTPFIEVGMGLLRSEEGLTGLVRVVTSTPETREAARAHMSFSEDEQENEYSTNIQIAELNGLCAALAVIRFKKLFAFYADSAHAYYEGYSVRSGELVKEGPDAQGNERP